MNLRLVVGTVVLACTVGAVSVAVSGQAGRPVQSASADDELVAEIRGLRADLAQAMSTNIRAQLLVGRLQLQEQRMNGIGAQLADVRRALADAETEQTSLAGKVKDIQESLDAGAIPAEQVRDVEGLSRALKQEVSRASPKLDALRNQEAELSTQLLSEQGRWIDFNAQLDDIERSLPTAPVRDGR